jgi:hypothetical protein
VILIVFTLGAFATYSFAIGDSDIALNYLISRIFAMQGQMWWAVDYEYYNNAMYDSRHLHVELQKIFSPESVSSTDIGMQYLMIAVLGPKLAYPIIEKGYLYTMTYPAILIATFPFTIAIVLQFFAGIVFFTLLYYLHFCIIYRHKFRAIIVLLMIIPFITVLFTGNYVAFFTFGMSIKFFILLGLELGGALRQARVMNHDKVHLSRLSQQ